MAIISRTVTINAAFLQEIKEDNRLLKGQLDELETVTQPRRMPHPHPRQLAAMLSDFRDRLAMHFALEEAYGYFDEPIDAAPRLSEAAEELRAEHPQLFDALCTLVERLSQVVYHESGSPRYRYVLRDIRRFLNRFTIHERRETDLIMQALCDDIGVGD